MGIANIIRRLRRHGLERRRQEDLAAHATVYVARDGRGRVVAAH
jgi:hypothetical protein